jgi:glucans biosynthesis protein C
VGAPDRASPVDFHGSAWEFFPEFFRCCYPSANFSYHHLWFIWYLLVYSVALTGVLALVRLWVSQQRMERTSAWFRTIPRLLILGVPIVILELALRRAFPGTHAFADDWANHAHYFYLVAVGSLMVQAPEAAEATSKRWVLLICTAVGFTVLWLTFRARLFPGNIEQLFPLRATIRYAGEWIWILALIGLGRQFLNRRLRGLSDFTRYAFPFYLVHQTIIVFLGWTMLAWSAAPMLKFIAIALLALLGSLMLCRLADFNSVTRLLLGIKSKAGKERE